MDVKDVFDDWARRGRAEGMEAGHGKTAGRLMDVLPIEEGSQFLDLGCGNGWACRQAAAKGATCVGIDVSEEMLERARMLGGGTFLQQDMADLPFEDNAFDVIWSMEAIYYAPDPDAVLAEIARVLRPGGHFHFLLDFYEENDASHSWPEDVGLRMELRSEVEWKGALAAAGLHTVESERLRATSTRAEAWKRQEGTLHLMARG